MSSLLPVALRELDQLLCGTLLFWVIFIKTPSEGACTVPWQVKSLPTKLTSYVGAALGFGCSTSNPLPANIPGKAVEDGPIVWAPVRHMGDLGRSSDSRFLTQLLQSSGE